MINYIENEDIFAELTQKRYNQLVGVNGSSIPQLKKQAIDMAYQYLGDKYDLDYEFSPYVEYSSSGIYLKTAKLHYFDGTTNDKYVCIKDTVIFGILPTNSEYFKKGDNDNFQMKKSIVSIFIYYICTAMNNPMNATTIITQKFEEAKKYFEAVYRGHITIGNLKLKESLTESVQTIVTSKVSEKTTRNYLRDADTNFNY